MNVQVQAHIIFKATPQNYDKIFYENISQTLLAREICPLRGSNCSEISGGILRVVGQPCRRCTRCRVRHASRITSWVGCRTTGSVTMSNESRAIARVSTSGMPWTIWNLEDHRRRTACAPSKFVNCSLRSFSMVYLLACSSIARAQTAPVYSYPSRVELPNLKPKYCNVQGKVEFSFGFLTKNRIRKKKKMTRLFGKNCLAHGRIKFSEDLQILNFGIVKKRIKCNIVVKFLFLLVKK